MAYIDNYTIKERRRRWRELLDSPIILWGQYYNRVIEDGGTVEALECLNEALYKLKF